MMNQLGRALIWRACIIGMHTQAGLCALHSASERGLGLSLKGLARAGALNLAALLAYINSIPVH